MPRDLADPPELPPEQLWRSLLPLPQERRLAYRLRGAESVPLLVRAFPAMAEALAGDAGARAAGDVPALRAREELLELLVQVLHTSRGRAFDTVEQLAALEDHELEDLALETRGVLADIAPTTGRSNLAAWSAALRVGAGHPDNLAEACVLASCIDVTPGGVIPRPDCYWGAPLRELCDGHWMAWQAARDAMKDRR